ncbi:MAG: hypothetical protein KGI51_09660 [Rhodospirillales bacterium]|nr:hypothetical protein [Rhodospirillales bacterium]
MQVAPSETSQAAAPVPFDPALGTATGAASVASGTGAGYQPSGADLLTGPDTVSSLSAIIVRTRN